MADDDFTDADIAALDSICAQYESQPPVSNASVNHFVQQPVPQRPTSWQGAPPAPTTSKAAPPPTAATQNHPHALPANSQQHHPHPHHLPQHPPPLQPHNPNVPPTCAPPPHAPTLQHSAHTSKPPPQPIMPVHTATSAHTVPPQQRAATHPPHPTDLQHSWPQSAHRHSQGTQHIAPGAPHAPCPLPLSSAPQQHLSTPALSHPPPHPHLASSAGVQLPAQPSHQHPPTITSHQLPSHTAAPTHSVPNTSASAVQNPPASNGHFQAPPARPPLGDFQQFRFSGGSAAPPHPSLAPGGFATLATCRPLSSGSSGSGGALNAGSGRPNPLLANQRPQQQHSGSGLAQLLGSGPSAGSGGATANGHAHGTASGRAAPTPHVGPPVSVCATVSLASGTHCSIRLSQSAPQLLEALRSYPGVRFDTPTLAWMVPIPMYKSVHERLDNTPNVNMSWKDLPPIVQSILKATAGKKDESGRYERVHTTKDEAGQTLDERMMPFQREGVQYGLKQGGRVLIGDEMGLGKTVQGCALLKCYEDEWPALIITPSSLRQQWSIALQQWTNALECDIQVVFDKNDMEQVKRAAGALAQKGSKSTASPPFRILVISYDYVAKMSDILMRLNFKCVLLDEAHYIKSFSSQRTKASLPLLQRARRTVLLTGTPALSRPIDLMTLMQALIPGAHIKLNDFAARYCQGDMYSKVAGAKNQQELFYLITATMMIRRRKADVLKQLPPKRRQQVYLKVDERDMQKLKGQQEEMCGLREVLKSVSSHTGGLLSGLRMEQQNAIMRMYHDTARIKVGAVQEYIKDLLESDIKFLVFAHHHNLLDGIEKAINTAKKGYIRIDGKTDAKQREVLRNKFQTDESVKVAVLGIAAAGVGLTLTAASTVVFAELSWVPGEIMQAEDRVHRIGQESNSVNIQFLLVKNTIDDIMWDTVQHKLTNVGKVLDGKEDSLAVASKSTVEKSISGPGPMDSFLTRRPNQSTIRSSAQELASTTAAAEPSQAPGVPVQAPAAVGPAAPPSQPPSVPPQPTVQGAPAAQQTGQGAPVSHQGTLPTGHQDAGSSVQGAHVQGARAPQPVLEQTHQPPQHVQHAHQPPQHAQQPQQAQYVQQAHQPPQHSQQAQQPQQQPASAEQLPLHSPPHHGAASLPQGPSTLQQQQQQQQQPAASKATGKRQHSEAGGGGREPGAKQQKQKRPR